MRALRPAWGHGLRAAWLCGWITAATLAPSPASADTDDVALVEGEVALEYHRAPSARLCPDEAQLRERAADSFDFQDPFVKPGAAGKTRLRIEVAREGRFFRATLSVPDDKGGIAASSSEQHVDCDALVWVLAHRVALALLRRPVYPVPPAAPPPAAPPPVPVPADPPPTAPDRACDELCMEDLTRRIHTTRVQPAAFTKRFEAGAFAWWGLANHVAPGFWFGIGFQRGWFATWIQSRSVLPTETDASGFEGKSAVSSFSTLIAPCAQWMVFLGCAFAEIGMFTFKAPPGINDFHSLLVDFGPRLGLDIPIGHGLAVRAFADLIVHPLSTTLRTLVGSDAKVVKWNVPRVTGAATLGISWSR